MSSPIDLHQVFVRKDALALLGLRDINPIKGAVLDEAAAHTPTKEGVSHYMHPLDKARVLKSLYERYQSYEQVARVSAWSAPTIRKYMQLLALPEDFNSGLALLAGRRAWARSPS
jgi:hypothetical protein